MKPQKGRDEVAKPECLGKISAEFRVNFLECPAHIRKEIQKDARTRRARNTTLTFYFLFNTTYK